MIKKIKSTIMSSSNTGKFRKKLAQELEAEIFSINTEIENLTQKLYNKDWKALNKLNLTKLKDIRFALYVLTNNIKKINKHLETVEQPYSGQIVEEVDGQAIFVNQNLMLNQ